MSDKEITFDLVRVAVADDSGDVSEKYGEHGHGGAHCTGRDHALKKNNICNMCCICTTIFSFFVAT